MAKSHMCSLKGRLIIVGLDCVGVGILTPESLSGLPNLRSIVAAGISGLLESTMPPITVPAWTSMLSGRDPGEIGLYGFRNRRSYAYGDMVYATSHMVRYPRIWDYVGQAGGSSLVVGVPQTWPTKPIEGVMIAGFEANKVSPKVGIPVAYPSRLIKEVYETDPDYQFDVDDFRNITREKIRSEIYRMTDSHFRLMKRLATKYPWDFAMLCEIGPDRLHHCFWSDHDPTHPRHKPHSCHRKTIRDYYSFLDQKLGELLQCIPPDTAVLVLSDHGAKPMHGGVCINEILRENGWLYLKKTPNKVIPLKPELVDWSKTRAWGEGGYYARIFLNVKNREPRGIIPKEQKEKVRHELSKLLHRVRLSDELRLSNQIIWPEKMYRRVRGLPPDLLVIFGDLKWRSVGSIGHNRTWIVGNDIGLDEANHAFEGFYAMSGPAIPQGVVRRASIMDMAPTILSWLGIDFPKDMVGHNILGS